MIGGGKIVGEPIVTLAEYVDAERRARRAEKLFTPSTMQKIIAACMKSDIEPPDPNAFDEFKAVFNDVLKSPADGTPQEISNFIEDIWAASKASRSLGFKPCW